MSPRECPRSEIDYLSSNNSPKH